MRLTRLDPETARRLFDGRVAPDDAPPGYSGVAALLTAARGAASGTERVREEATVAAMQGVVLERLDTPTIDPRRRHVRKKVLAAKTAAATTVVLLGAGAAAAAAGALPGAAQGTASNVLSKIGVSVPGNDNGHANSRGHSTSAGTKANTGNTVNGGTSNRQGKGPNPHAFPGLCRAQIASAGHPNSNSVVRHVDCSGITPAGGGANTNSGSDQPSGAPNSSPDSGTPPVTTPNHGAAGGHDGGGSTSSGGASGGKGNAGSRP